MEAMKAELEERGRELISLTREALEEKLLRQQVERLFDRFYDKLLERALEKRINMNMTGGQLAIIEELTMRDQYIAEQVGAQGPGAQADHMTFIQLWNQSGQSLDLPALATELTTLRQAMRKEAKEPFHDKAVVQVGEAQEAAQNHDGPRALQHLKNAGQWALDVATKVGVNLATEALKKVLAS